MDQTKQKSKTFLFSLSLLPFLLLANIADTNLLRTPENTDENKVTNAITQTSLLADGYFEYQDQTIGVNLVTEITAIMIRSNF